METETPAIDGGDREAWLRGRLARFLTPRPSTRSRREDELLARGTDLGLVGGLAAASWGEGPPVLLAHGWESRRAHWIAFIPALVAAGFRAVVVDAPAHGDSPGETANVLQYARALAAAGAELGPLAGAVGHSFGSAAVAISLREGLDARRAVLVAGPSSLVGVVRRWCARHRIEGPDAARLLEMVEEDVGEPLAGLEVARFAPGLATPALVVHDVGDEAVPVAEARAVAAAWPGSTLRLTEKYGHNRILLARRVVGEVVDFLKAGAD